MKAATIRELKQELNTKSDQELIDICLRLSKFKKENKELLTYLLYEAENETSYIQDIKEELDEQFSEINTESYYFIKKSVRKILRGVKKYIRYSKKKETEVELLIYFCYKMRRLEPKISRSTILMNIYHQQTKMIRNAISKLHEDLQYDYEIELNKL